MLSKCRTLVRPASLPFSNETAKVKGEASYGNQLNHLIKRLKLNCFHLSYLNLKLTVLTV